MRFIILLFLCISPICSVNAQKTITKQNLVWVSYFNNVQIGEKWIITSDIQERFFFKPVKQHQYIVRSIARYKIKNSGWDMGAGLCFFLANNDPTRDYNLHVPEIRPTMDIYYQQKTKNISVNHRYRLDARFFKNTSGQELADGFSFTNMRFRYQIGLSIPLYKGKEDRNALALKVAEEIHVNFGKKIIKNAMDQNRVTAGIQYAPNKDLAIELAYINWFQQRTAGDTYFSRDIISLRITQNIKITKKS